MSCPVAAGSATTVPELSVVVATYQRADQLPRLFDALGAQDASRTSFEVIVVDNGSTDETPRVLRDLVASVDFMVQTIRLEENRGPALGRNAGWRAARSETIAFTDDDCRPVPGWISSLLRAIRDASLRPAIFLGPTSPDPEEIEWLQHPFSRSLSVSEPRFFETCNVVYERGDLERAGGFDESFGIGGEDTDLGLRLTEDQRPIVWVPDAMVHHQVRRPSFRANLREARRWSNLPLVVHRHPQARRDLVHHRWFWKSTHPPTILAMAGITLATLGRRPQALVGGLWWLYHRTVVVPPCPRRRDRLWALPGVFVIDATEVVTMVRGSVRHRSILL